MAENLVFQLPELAKHGADAALVKFVWLTINNIPVNSAKAEVGYKNVRVADLYSTPQYARVLALLQRKWLQDIAVPAAFRALYSIATDNGVKPAARVAASNSLLDRAGHVQPKDGDPNRHLDPEQMTTEQLHAYITKLDREIIGRAHDITPVSAHGAPVVARDADDLSDLIG